MMCCLYIQLLFMSLSMASSEKFNSSIPPGYDGREQALIKHRLLEAYLQKLFLIVGMSGRSSGKIELCYVDCFAGPWGDTSERIETTSIAISLGTLEACRQELAKRGVTARIRALYIEEDGTAFERLQTYLKDLTPAGLVADSMHGDFVSLRGKILEWTGRRAFAFFFIDPTGWKEIGISTLRPLLSRPRSEFLVNFMYDFVNRMASMREYQSDFSDLVGEAIDVSKLAPEKREQLIVKTYRDNLKGIVPSTRSEFRSRAAHVRVLDPSKERPKYCRGMEAYVQTCPDPKSPGDWTMPILRGSGGHLHTPSTGRLPVPKY